MNFSIEKLRLPLWVTLAAVVYGLYFKWQLDYPPPIGSTSSLTEQSTPVNELPPLPAGTNSAPAATPTTSVTATAPIVTGTIIHIHTDVLDIDLNTLGGELTRADLLRYPAHKDTPNISVRLFNTDPATYFTARSGLRPVQEDSAPTHQTLFIAEADQYQLKEGANELVVPLKWTNEQGIEVVKTYTFHRGQYAIDVKYQVNNHSANAWRAYSYVQLQRRQPKVATSIFRGDTYSHMGPAAFDGKSYKNLKLDKEEDKHYQRSASGGWAAAVQHHFIAATVPDATQTYDYQLQVTGSDAFTFTSHGPLQTIEPNASGDFKETLFVGPKLQDQLTAVGSRLQLATDYGIFTILADPLFWLLSHVHAFIGNWGWAIIIVTLLIKLAFYKLTQTSGRSMAKMKEVAPRLKALQERYKDDREQLGRATMEFYKREKINPVAGCLPMLIQMPFWMAFYWVLANNVEMRQAPFMGWITDLSSRDPYFILPITLGIANFVQFKLNPAPADPMQAKIMGIMPIMFTVMMAWFPSGLALYWVTNTLLSILQQWYINKTIAAQSAKKD